MGMRIGSVQDSFVAVSYDFEYTTEEGKQVWMKEGEILLLLSKTNNDWWQVIRRGNRRPFYAPARYVVELSHDMAEWESVFAADGIHYRPDNGEPIHVQDKKNLFSTFLGGGGGGGGGGGSGVNLKRASFASPSPPSQPASDFLFRAHRFQERYKSNSMDSLLVPDFNRQAVKPKANYLPNSHLEKRPTFENIDKRLSWSQDKYMPGHQDKYLGPSLQEKYHSGHMQDKYHAAALPLREEYFPPGGPRTSPAYPVHHPMLVPGQPPPHATLGIPLHMGGPPPPVVSGGKKPVPLPRSKIPVPTKSATMERAVHPELRTFKRSKTDLNLGVLNQYKANRAASGSGGGSSSGGSSRRSVEAASMRSQDDSSRLIGPPPGGMQDAGIGGGGPPASAFLGSFSHNEFMAGNAAAAHTRLAPTQSLLARRGQGPGASSSSSRPSTIREADETLTSVKPFKKSDASSGGKGGEQNSQQQSRKYSGGGSYSQQRRMSGDRQAADAVAVSGSSGVTSGGQKRAKESPLKEQKRSTETFRKNSDQNQNYQTKAPAKPVIKDKPNVHLKKSSFSSDPKPSERNLSSSSSDQVDSMEKSRKPSDQTERGHKLSEQSDRGRKQSDMSDRGRKESEQSDRGRRLSDQSDRSRKQSESSLVRLEPDNAQTGKDTDDELKISLKVEGFNRRTSEERFVSESRNDDRHSVGSSSRTDRKASGSGDRTVPDNLTDPRDRRRSGHRKSSGGGGSAERQLGEGQKVVSSGEVVLKNERQVSNGSSERSTAGGETRRASMESDHRKVSGATTPAKSARDRERKSETGQPGEDANSRVGDFSESSRDKRSTHSASGDLTTSDRQRLRRDSDKKETSVRPDSQKRSSSTSIQLQSFLKGDDLTVQERKDKASSAVGASSQSDQHPPGRLAKSPGNRMEDHSPGRSSRSGLSPGKLTDHSEGRQDDSTDDVEEGDDCSTEPLNQISEPLVISTELLAASCGSSSDRLPVAGSSGSSSGGGGHGATVTNGQMKGEEKSVYSSSFDSLDGSLDSSGWPEGGDWLGSEPTRTNVVSPNNSTCSRTPSSPIPGSTPLRTVQPDWEEHLDSSGRKFYYNVRTHEKSWKPPRIRNRGTSEGYSAPTSPDPSGADSAFEMSPGVSESESRSAEEGGEGRGMAHSDTVGDTSATELNADSSMLDNQDSTRDDDVEVTISTEAPAPTLQGERIPSGYEIRFDGDERYFVNIFTGVCWYSAQDQDGRTYYYQENSDKSCWELPNVAQTFQDHSVNPSPVPDSQLQNNNNNNSSSSVSESHSALDPPGVLVTDTSHHGVPQSMTSGGGASLATACTAFKPFLSTQTSVGHESTLPGGRVLLDPVHAKHETLQGLVPGGEVQIPVLKQGALFKTRLEDRGKKYRKNWSSCNLVLTDKFIIFYKDTKSFSKPDQHLDLGGARIEWCNSDKSKRLNVFEISTVLEQKILLQDDDFTVANDWFSRIETVIVTLSQKELVVRNIMQQKAAANSAVDGAVAGFPRTDGTASTTSTLLSNNSSKKSKVNRTKSLKLTTTLTSGQSAANEPDSPSVVNVPIVKEKSKIRDKLRKFFLRRPNMEDLMKRGIMKNEPVFGSTLTLLSKVEQSEVPLFVKKCIQVLESKQDFLQTDGVYRQSGNLSTVQRLRLQIDHGNTDILDTIDDVHVLTGALKLFFRELKEPLIPWESVDRLITAASLPSRKAKIKALKEEVARLPASHQSTLIFLLRHLDKVTTHKLVNRMAVSNLAIVFGPTLMWPPTNLTNTNIALNMMQQNMIVEALITNLSHIV